ncbi:MAG: UDP-glucose 4-epimerase GalE [Cocleimonas sp.]
MSTTRGNVLVTGGAGYIGSHTVISLVKQGFKPVILDNFVNSSPIVIDRLSNLIGKPISCVQCDCRDNAALDAVFAAYNFLALIHFAGLKSVSESISDSLGYYDCNVSGFIDTLRAAQRAKVDRIIFSSSATVYRANDQRLISETDPLQPTNPYGQSKLICEQILQDYCIENPSVSAVILRYFNPIGAHPSGNIGESPLGIPNNILPFISRVGAGKTPALTIYGGDYETVDGTGVRDYIHVNDLADGHVRSLEYTQGRKGAKVFNLGTGKGTSVLELVRFFEQENNITIPYTIGPRRLGDLGQVVANPVLAERELNFKALRSVAEACRDAWNWTTYNPEGFT